MRRKIISIFGIVAVVAFFLPWLKGCDAAESGFELFILDSLKEFDSGAISIINTGLLFLLVPLYAIITAWMGTTTSGRFIKAAFAVLCAMTLWDTSVWGGSEISDLIRGLGTDQHSHLIIIATLGGIKVIGLILNVAFVFRWVRLHRFNPGLSQAVLIFPIFGTLGAAFAIEPGYYGMWLYLAMLILLFIGSVWDGIAEWKTTGTNSGSIN